MGIGKQYVIGAKGMPSSLSLDECWSICGICFWQNKNTDGVGYEALCEHIQVQEIIWPLHGEKVLSFTKLGTQTFKFCRTHPR